MRVRSVCSLQMSEGAKKGGGVESALTSQLVSHVGQSA
jgi:hypothetical protein